MNIKYPASFSFMLIVMASTAALSVLWSFSHMCLLLANLAAIWFLRMVAHGEIRQEYRRFRK